MRALKSLWINVAIEINMNYYKFSASVLLAKRKNQRFVIDFKGRATPLPH